MKLQYKLYLFFTAVVLLPLLVVTITASVVLSRSGEETYQSRIRSALAAASAVISGEARELASNLQAALQPADTNALASGSTNQRRTTLASVMQRSGATSAVMTDSGGNILASAGDPLEGAPPMISATVQLSPAGGALWQVTVYHSFDAEVLASIFSSQQLDWGLLENETVSMGSLPEGNQVARKDSGPEGPASPDLAEGEFYQASIGDSGIMASSIGLPRSITSRDTVLLTGVRDEVVGAASRQVLSVGVGLMLLVAVLAGVLGFLLARNITGPLRELNAAAAAGISGHLDRRVEVRSSDEIGNLAGSFNEMQASISNYITELEDSRSQLLLALSYAGDILGSTADRARLLKVTAEAALLATGARGIWVESFESPETRGGEAIFMGVPASFFEDGRGEAAHQFALEASRSYDESSREVSLDENFGAEVYPIIKEKKIHGALVAVHDRNLPMEESRKKILSSLTTQAASALDNVDIAELQRTLAITDPMTGLYNFRYLISSLVKELEKVRRYERQMAVAILDLDFFKQVNDTFGHLAGDELLKKVAETLLENVRGADIVARYGGEEFAVIMPETSKATAAHVMEKLRWRIAGARLENYPEVSVTVSIGVAGFPEDGVNQSELLARADEALYLSKKAGKNRITLA